MTTQPNDLYVVFGPSGAGKTTLAKHIYTRSDRPDCVYLDADIINPISKAMGEQAFTGIWLMLCSQIPLSGRPCVLFSCLQPEVFDTAGWQRDRVGEIHYFALYCSDEELETRLQRRIRETTFGSPDKIPGMQQWSKAIRDGDWGYGELQEKGLFTPHDTTHQTVDQTADSLFAWLAKFQ